MTAIHLLLAISLTLSPNGAVRQASSCPTTNSSGSVADDLFNWGCRAANWMNQGLKFFKGVARAEDRQRTATALRRFAKDVNTIEQDKRYLLDALRRKRISQSELDIAVGDLRRSVEAAQRTLKQELSPLLLDAYKAGGDSVESLLRSSLGARKEWVYQVSSGKLTSMNLARVLQAGDSAVASLRRAQLATRTLADSLEALQ